MCRRDVNRKSRRLNQYPNHKSQRGGECFHCCLLLPDHRRRFFRLFVWTIQPSAESFDSFKQQTVPVLKWNAAVWLGVSVLLQGVDGVSAVQYPEPVFPFVLPFVTLNWRELTVTKTLMMVLAWMLIPLPVQPISFCALDYLYSDPKIM